METTTIRRNVDRFIASTGKSEAEYQQWATEVGRKMHINKLDALICARLELYTVAHLAYRPTEFPEDIQLQEVNDFIIQNSENPYEIGKAWLSVQSDAASWVSKESILAEHLRAFPKPDFERFGDINHLSSVSRSWFHNEGINLDVQLEEINDMMLHAEYITSQDAIDFVMNYKPKTYKNPCELLLKDIEARFKAITTFQIKDYYIDHLVRMCELEPYDTGDVPF